MIDVQIHHGFRRGDNENVNNQEDERRNEKFNMQAAYASPIRYPLSGTTGAAESDSKSQKQ